MSDPPHDLANRLHLVHCLSIFYFDPKQIDKHKQSPSVVVCGVETTQWEAEIMKEMENTEH